MSVVVVSCVGGLDSPISHVFVRLAVHLAGYHLNAMAMCSPPGHTFLLMPCYFRREGSTLVTRRSSWLVSSGGGADLYQVTRRGSRARCCALSLRFVTYHWERVVSRVISRIACSLATLIGPSI